MKNVKALKPLLKILLSYPLLIITVSITGLSPTILMSPAFAFSQEAKEETLDIILDLQESRQAPKNKKSQNPKTSAHYDNALRAITDSLIYSINNKITAPNLPKGLKIENYKRALELQIEYQKQDPENDIYPITIEALVERISLFESLAHSQSSDSCVGETSNPKAQLNRLSSQVQAIARAQSDGSRKQIRDQEYKHLQMANRLEHLPSAFRKNQNRLKRKEYWVEDQKQVPQHWLNYQMMGDGDCSLHGMKQTRAEFIERLKNHLNDPGKRNAVMNDLRSNVAQYFCKDIPKKSECLSGFTPVNDKIHLEFFQHYVDEVLSKKTSWLDFDYNGDLNPTGSLVAAARVFQKNVTVWSEDQGKLVPALQITNDPNGTVTHLIHQNNHFNLLVNAKDLKGRQDALQQESEVLEDYLKQ